MEKHTHSNQKGHFSLSVSSWGNSLAMRIPKTVAAQLGLELGSVLDASIEEGKLVISPRTDLQHLASRSERMNLAAMVKKIKPSNRHTLDDDGPEGDEVW